MPDSTLDNLDKKFTTSFWTDHLNADEITTFVAEIENEIVGFCSLMPSRDADADKKSVAEISAINISPRHWRKGAGSQLCERVFTEAKKHGYSTLALWVLETNHSARKFYEATGFALDGGQKTIELGGRNLPEVRYRYSLPR